MPVRLARRDEAGEIAELWLELVTFHHTLDPTLPTAAPDGDVRYAHFVMMHIERPDSAVFVAVNSRGGIIGYALAMTVDLVPETFKKQRAGLLADIYVQPHERRQGYGRALYQAVVDWCNTHGLQTLEWEVAAQNTLGRAFWRAMGGRELMVRMRVGINKKGEKGSSDDGNDETLPDR